MAKKAKVPAMREQKLPLIGLVLVVKDGQETLPQMLLSVLPLIGTWTVCDTGSTDHTRTIVRQLLGHLPGELVRHKWRDFSTNYNMALARAQGRSRWMLHMHADEEIGFINSDLTRWLGGRRGQNVHGYDVTIDDHGLELRLPRLLRGDLDWRYEYPTHEYLETDGRAIPPLKGLRITHHGHGKGPDALLRDIELLKPRFEKGEARAIFYTAESHRYLGNLDQAAQIYKVRASMDGSEDSLVKVPASFEEERWYAAYQAAYLMWDAEGLIDVWRERPWRHEPLSAAARFAAEQGKTSGDVMMRETFGQPTQPLPYREHPAAEVGS